MEHPSRALAFDFGASSGRAILGTFDGETIRIEEVHRFSNDPVAIRGTLYWDVLRQYYEIKQGLLKAKQHGGFDTVAVDTWGVDFGLLDEGGYLLDNPVHYRDQRTKGLVEESFKSIPQEEFYQLTGIQLMELNTVFQLMALKRQRPALLERAKTLLFMPDLFNYLLTGKKQTEFTIASTSQLLDAQTGGWSEEVLLRLGIPKNILTPIVLPGKPVGPLEQSICEELGLVGALALILLFSLMIWRFMVIAMHAEDLFGALLAAGIMGHIAIQVILNIAVVTNSIPNTGITLPFVSYGGTSVCFLLAEMGIALSVSARTKL